MLQGVYIFLIFVCKRNVWAAVMPTIYGRKGDGYDMKKDEKATEMGKQARGSR